MPYFDSPAADSYTAAICIDMQKNLSWSAYVTSLGRLMQLLLCFVCLLGCAASPSAPATAPTVEPPAAGPEVPAVAKIASSVQNLIERLRADGITAANVATRHPESYSTPLMRVDDTGRIQTVIQVTTVDKQVESVLEQQGVHIDITDEALHLIQAWIPFERVEQVAQLPFVRYIRPPSYAFRR